MDDPGFLDCPEMVWVNAARICRLRNLFGARVDKPTDN
jgi:hypothetical protein